MRLATYINLYNCDIAHLSEWDNGMRKQIDWDYEIVYYRAEHINDTLLNTIDDYDAVLFLDIDDIPQPALISAAKQYAEKHDVTAVGMWMVEDGEITGLFGAPTNITEYNVHGLGNTVYRTEVLKDILPIDIVWPLDYHLAKKAHEAGYELAFKSLPLIHYRQYGQNDRIVEVEGGRAWRI